MQEKKFKFKKGSKLYKCFISFILILFIECNNKTSLNKILNYETTKTSFLKEIQTDTNSFISANLIKNIEFNHQNLSNTDSKFLIQGQLDDGLFITNYDDQGNKIHGRSFLNSAVRKIYPIILEKIVNENDYIMGGYISFEPNNFDIFTIIINPNTLETKKIYIYTSIGNDIMAKAVTFKDNKMRLWGSIKIDQKNGDKLCYIDIDLNDGTIINSKFLNLEGYKTIEEVIYDKNDDIYILRGTDSQNKQSIFVAEMFSNSTNLHSYKKFNADKEINIYKTLKINDTNILLGQTKCCESIKKNGIIIIDKLNETIATTIGGSGDDRIFDGFFDDEALVLLMNTNSYDYNKNGILFEKIDFDFNHIWGKRSEKININNEILSFYYDGNYIYGAGRKYKNKNDIKMIFSKNSNDETLDCNFYANIEPTITIISDFITIELYNHSKHFENFNVTLKNITFNIDDLDLYEDFVCTEEKNISNNSTYFTTTIFQTTSSSSTSTTNTNTNTNTNTIATNNLNTSSISFQNITLNPSVSPTQNGNNSEQIINFQTPKKINIFQGIEQNKYLFIESLGLGALIFCLFILMVYKLGFFKYIDKKRDILKIKQSNYNNEIDENASNNSNNNSKSSERTDHYGSANNEASNSIKLHTPEAGYQ